MRNNYGQKPGKSARAHRAQPVSGAAVVITVQTTMRTDRARGQSASARALDLLRASGRMLTNELTN